MHQTAILQVGAQEKLPLEHHKAGEGRHPEASKAEVRGRCPYGQSSRVKDWMAEVKKKVIRGVPRSREYGRYLKQMQVVRNKRNDG